ncbi:MAG: hypothetical protein HQL90_04170 [Magnetococcales bacterium]|nr:hypothetical protein [Magnetococcales bacterium]
MKSETTTDRPIKFKGSMIPAILSGAKTQTRRTVDPQPLWCASPVRSAWPPTDEWSFGPHNLDGPNLRWWKSPYGEEGDIIAVAAGDDEAEVILSAWPPILLQITWVRIERLHAASNADIEAEGVPLGQWPSMWDSIYGDGAWEANPWVWVYEFKRLEG